MPSNVLTLRLPSDGITAFAFPSPRTIRNLLKKIPADTPTTPELAFWKALLDDPLTEKELLRIAKRVTRLVRPLTRAETPAELDRLVSERMQAYLLLESAFFEVLLNPLRKLKPETKFSIQDFVNTYTKTLEEAQKFFREKAPLFLDDDSCECLLIAFTGLRHYSENLVRLALQEGLQAIDAAIWETTVGHFRAADMLLLAVFLVLNREIRFFWKKASLTLIVHRAEEHIDTIENVILTQHPDFRERLECEIESSMPLGEYRRQRGLG